MYWWSECRRLPRPVLLVRGVPLSTGGWRQVPHRQRSHHLRRPRVTAAARCVRRQATASFRRVCPDTAVTGCSSRQAGWSSDPYIIGPISRRQKSTESGYNSTVVYDASLQRALITGHTKQINLVELIHWCRGKTDERLEREVIYPS